MKVQHRQEYCLLLTVDCADYDMAGMKAVFYAQDLDGLWQEVVFAEGLLRDFGNDENGQILYADEWLSVKLSQARDCFQAGVEEEKARRAEEEKRYAEAVYVRERDNTEDLWDAATIRGADIVIQ